MDENFLKTLAMKLVIINFIYQVLLEVTVK